MDIHITIKNYRCFPDQKPARILFRKGFTAFVGVNNSGKSSLLRFFYEFRQLFSILSQPHGEFLDALKGVRRSFSLMPSIQDPDEIFCNTNNRDLEIELSFLNQPSRAQGAPPYPNRLALTIFRGTSAWIAQLYIPGQTVGSQNTPLNFSDKWLSLQETPVADLSCLYKVCKDISEALYIGAFRNAINIGTKEDYFDIQVGEAFIQKWRQFKTGTIKRFNEATYKLTEDIKHIFGYNALEINPSEDNKTLQIFINGKSFKLSELGSGLTQFILVLANAATKQPSYVLIDEPELNLHPSLQLDFLTTLASYAREGVLFATHNIGLARASAELVYSIRRISEGESQVATFEETPRLSEFLGELSFFGYRELGFDKILLVEGSTEVKTIQQFLRLYKKDHEVVLLPLGGSQLIKDKSEAELEEIKRISDNVFALIDSERDYAGAPLPRARQGFLDLCHRAKIKCHALDYRAIENYFSDRAVRKVKDEKYRALQPFEKLTDVSPCWSKAENWRIAREMTGQELETTDLGKFFDLLSR